MQIDSHYAVSAKTAVNKSGQIVTAQMSFVRNETETMTNFFQARGVPKLKIDLHLFCFFAYVLHFECEISQIRCTGSWYSYGGCDAARCV